MPTICIKDRTFTKRFRTSTVTVTANPESENPTITISSCAPPQTPAAKAKRASKKPACLLKYTARAQISSACSCLSLKPSTRTVSSTVNGAGSTQTTTFTPTITNTNYELEPAATAAFNIAARGGGVIGGSYATTDTNYPQFNSYQSSATTFRLLGNRLVATDGTYADDPYFLGITIVDEDPAPMRRVVLDLNAHSLSCRIVYDMLGCYIECNTGQTGYTYNYDCGNWYWLKANDFTTQCSGFRPYAVST